MISTLEKLIIIKKKLIKNLAIDRVIKVTKSILLFISSLLGLISKHNKNWQKVYYLSHLQDNLINNYISNRVKKLRYILFKKFSNLLYE